MRHAWNLKRHNKGIEAPHIPNKVQLIYSASAVNELVFQVSSFFIKYLSTLTFYTNIWRLEYQPVSCNVVFTLPDTDTGTKLLILTPTQTSYGFYTILSVSVSVFQSRAVWTHHKCWLSYDSQKVSLNNCTPLLSCFELQSKMENFQDKIDDMCTQCEDLKTTYHVTKETPTNVKYNGKSKNVKFLSIVWRFFF